ncbi:MAG: YggS family pyridoxal phosphate-dependent enzyme [Planctomycetota bacterium]
MTDDDVLSARVRENLAVVQGRVNDACRRAGRDPSAVKIVGVTKYVSAELAAVLLEAGCHDLAESRPQSLWAKAGALAGAASPPRWHLVGHLQRNKVRRTLPLLTLLHSLDSQRLLETIDTEAGLAGVVTDVLVEVNLTGDPARTGLAVADVPPLVEAAAGCSHVRMRGLMGMASAPEGPDASGRAREQFAALRSLRDRLAAELSAAQGLEELSMGMSDDFEDAILEGATLVRIGSALWIGVE